MFRGRTAQRAIGIAQPIDPSRAACYVDEHIEMRGACRPFPKRTLLIEAQK